MAETPNIVFASANLMPVAAGLMGPEAVGQYAQEAGYDGVEYHIIHTRHYSVNDVVAAASQPMPKLPLNSLHASFRTNDRSRDTNKFGGNRGLLDLAIDRTPLGRFLMPEMVESTVFMSEIQRKLAQPVPAIVFPQGNKQTDQTMRRRAGNDRSPVLFQPTDHVASLVGARTFDEFEDTMLGERGYSGYCLDTFHARREYADDPSGHGIISGPDAWLGLLENTKAVQLSLNRVDFPRTAAPDVDGQAELKDALTGDFKGFHADVFAEVKRHKQIGYIAVELQSSALRPLAKEQGMTVQQGLRGHCPKHTGPIAKKLIYIHYTNYVKYWQGSRGGISL